MRAVALLLLISSPVFAGELIVHAGSWHDKQTYTTTTTVDHTMTYTYTYQGVPYIVESGVVQLTSTETLKYNHTNPGVGYRADNGWTFGVYRNSYSAASVYVGKYFPLLGRVGVTIGGVTGYNGRSNDNRVSPLAEIEWSIPVDNQYSAVLVAVPKLKRDGVNTVHFAISYKF